MDSDIGNDADTTADNRTDLVGGSGGGNSTNTVAPANTRQPTITFSHALSELPIPRCINCGRGIGGLFTKHITK